MAAGEPHLGCRRRVAGRAPLSRGQVWWARLRGRAKTRPVVLVSREEAYPRRALLMIAPVTRRIRGIPSEVPLGRTEGLAAESVVNCDTLRTIDRSLLVDQIGRIDDAKLGDLDAALRFALGLD